MNKTLDIAAVVALVAVIGSGVGWIISIEKRMANRLTLEFYYADQKLLKEIVHGRIENLRTEMNTDVKNLHDRINNFRCPERQPITSDDQ